MPRAELLALGTTAGQRVTVNRGEEYACILNACVPIEDTACLAVSTILLLFFGVRTLAGCRQLIYGRYICFHGRAHSGHGGHGTQEDDPEAIKICGTGPTIHNNAVWDVL